MTHGETMVPIDRALYTIPFVTAPLSFFSSIYLMSRIFKKGRTNWRKPKEQLLLGLSLLDIFGSFAFSWSTVPAPAKEHGVYPTYGTIATCNAQGFGVQVGIAVPLYNAALCLYYILTIRYKWRGKDLMKWLIPAIHVFILTFAFGMASAGLFLKIYGQAGIMGCWIKPKYSSPYHLYFAVIHISACLVFVIGSMIFLYCTVRKIEQETRIDSLPTNSQTNIGRTASRTGGDPLFSHGSSVVEDASEAASVTVELPGTPISAPGSRQLSRRMRDIGVFYGLSYILVYTPTAILDFAIGDSSFAYDATRVLVVLLLPLQGFFNMLIYTMDDWLPCFRMCCCCQEIQTVSKRKRSDDLTSSRVINSAFVLRFVFGISWSSRIRSDGDTVNRNESHTDEQLRSGREFLVFGETRQ